MLLRSVPCITEEIEALAGGAGSALGTGGMKTKIHAAKLCAAGGTQTVIANGENPALLYEIVAGNEGKFTRFFAK